MILYILKILKQLHLKKGTLFPMNQELNLYLILQLTQLSQKFQKSQLLKNHQNLLIILQNQKNPLLKNLPLKNLLLKNQLITQLNQRRLLLKSLLLKNQLIILQSQRNQLLKNQLQKSLLTTQLNQRSLPLKSLLQKNL